MSFFQIVATWIQKFIILRIKINKEIEKKKLSQLPKINVLGLKVASKLLHFWQSSHFCIVQPIQTCHVFTCEFFSFASIFHRSSYVFFKRKFAHHSFLLFDLSLFYFYFCSVLFLLKSICKTWQYMNTLDLCLYAMWTNFPHKLLLAFMTMVLLCLVVAFVKSFFFFVHIIRNFNSKSE